jgi:DNA-binding CsgD family transcriptional regulator
MDSSAYSKLTEREQEILQLVLSGHSNSNIAGELYVTINTTKMYIQSIIAKLNAGDNDGNPPCSGSSVPRKPLPNGDGDASEEEKISSILQERLLEL